MFRFFSIVFCFYFLVSSLSQASSTPRDFKLAFIGDQGFSSTSKSVLKLIKNEGAELLIHQGDFDYLDKPGFWEKNVNKYLGDDFPYIASAGNHDAKMWFDLNGYRDRLERRAQRIPGMNCTGDHGVNGACVYKGVLVITSGIGSIGKKHKDYLEGVLNQSDSFIWKICSWHKQKKEYQVGDKGSAVPWDFYKACRKAGAIIAQGHEHSYSRTYTMENFKEFKVADKDDVLKVGQDMSFAFTNGLGGASIRPQKRCKKKKDCPFMANIYTRDQGAKAGALFCTLHVNGKENVADCYFKNIRGDIIDEFGIVSLNAEGRSEIVTSPPGVLWYPTARSSSADVWHSHHDRRVCL